MNASPTAYPLQWPVGYPRTEDHARQHSRFSTGRDSKPSLGEGVGRVLAQLHSFGSALTDRVISTNAPLRRDGYPSSSAPLPRDPGAAVYFTLNGQPVVLACDKWRTLPCNLTAIAHTLEAMRGLQRWGVTQAERAFTGFAALPAPGQVQALTCWQVLGISPTTDALAIQRRWRELARTAHPDMPGGSHQQMAALNTARDQALAQAHP